MSWFGSLYIYVLTNSHHVFVFVVVVVKIFDYTGTSSSIITISLDDCYCFVYLLRMVCVCASASVALAVAMCDCLSIVYFCSYEILYAISSSLRMKWDEMVCVGDLIEFTITHWCIMRQTSFRSPAARRARACIWHASFHDHLERALLVYSLTGIVSIPDYFSFFSFDWTTTFCLFLKFWKQISSKSFTSTFTKSLEIYHTKNACKRFTFSSYCDSSVSRLLSANAKGFFSFIFVLRNASLVCLSTITCGIGRGSKMCAHVVYLCCHVVSVCVYRFKWGVEGAGGSLRCSMVHASPWNWPSSYTWR